MAKYIPGKTVVELMREGWTLNTNTNFNNTRIKSYWLGKAGEVTEHVTTTATIAKLKEAGTIDKNDMLAKNGEVSK